MRVAVPPLRHGSAAGVHDPDHPRRPHPILGMLPGLVASVTTASRRLSISTWGRWHRFAGAPLPRHGAGLDLDKRQVLVAGRRPVGIRLLCCRSTSGRAHRLQTWWARWRHVMPVKPIDTWLQRWQDRSGACSTAGVFRISVVRWRGRRGGDGAVHSAPLLRSLLAARRGDREGQIELLHDARPCCKTQSRCAPTLRARKCSSVASRCCGHRVVSVTRTSCILRVSRRESRERGDLDHQAAAAAWPGRCRAGSRRRRVRSRQRLSAIAVAPSGVCGGDGSPCRTRPENPGCSRAAPGCCAGRESAAPAAVGLCGATGHSAGFLGLISTGDRYAIASRGGWSGAGEAWLWTLEGLGRCRFMQRFNVLPSPWRAGGENWHPV